MTLCVGHPPPPPPSLMALVPSIFTPGKGPKNTSFIKEIFVNCRPPSTFNFFVAFRRKSFFKANKKHILVCFGNPGPPPPYLTVSFLWFFCVHFLTFYVFSPPWHWNGWIWGNPLPDLQSGGSLQISECSPQYPHSVAPPERHLTIWYFEGPSFLEYVRIRVRLLPDYRFEFFGQTISCWQTPYILIRCYSNEPN